MPNPYSLTFGQPPIEIIERAPQLNQIVSDFCRPIPANHIYLITGIRGSGKTVFLTEAASRIKEKSDWFIINLNPQRDLLMALAAKLNSNHQLSGIFQADEINLEFFGFGIGLKTSNAITDIEEALSRMLESIRKHGKRVLITIDEAINSKELRIFASAFQIFLRDRLPVFLLMTGLYKHIDQLRNADGMTFLERAPRIILGPLNNQLIMQKYQETLHMKIDEATRLAKATRGYSFAFQTMGYFCYEYNPDMKEALSAARSYLYEFAYWKIWSELSRKDREVLKAFASVPTGRVSEIREKLHYSTNQFNPYRDRLIKSGVLISRENGFVEWALPWFEDFTRQAVEEAP